MTSWIFLAYVAALIAILLWMPSIRVPRWIGMLIGIIAAMLIYDNAVIALGGRIGDTPLLHTLSLPRFWLHAFVTPLLLVVAFGIARTSGLGWAQSRYAPYGVGVLYLLLVLAGLLPELNGLALHLACYDDTLRYSKSLYESQLCYNWQSPTSAGAPPVGSMMSIIFVLLIGLHLAVARRQLVLLLGAVIMLIGAGIPARIVGPLPANGAEILITISLILALVQATSEVNHSQEMQPLRVQPSVD